MKISNKVILILTLCTLGTLAQAVVTLPNNNNSTATYGDVTGATETDVINYPSATNPPSKHVRVGASQVKNYIGKAGINIIMPSATGNTANNKFVAFEKITSQLSNPLVTNSVLEKDTNNVYVSRMYRMPAILNWVPGMPKHRDLGRASFTQVDNLDVWFGDWANVAGGAPAGTAGTNYSVYYAGTGHTATMPTTGTATYTVQGINNYVNKNSPLLTGIFDVDFGTNTLDGSIAKPGLTIGVNATINPSNASFAGTASATGGINGTSQGNFYGNNAKALAGIATFGQNDSANTAFGGTKD